MNQEPSPPLARLLRYDPEPGASRRMRDIGVIAQDPSVQVDGRVLRSTVSVPAERLEPGPRGTRFHVVDYDATHRRLVAPGDWSEAIATAPDADLVAEPAVRAQQVYAVAARTLEIFENALGRRLPWSFPGHQLYLVPAAFAEPNAFYDPDNGAILFGYFTPSADDPRGATVPCVYTSLSHDVVAHETTHAILDGMRRRFEEPSLPDQAAFHEALADIVALLSVFSLPEVVGRLLPGDADARLLAADDASRDGLARGALFGLAEQVGAETSAHGGALRRAVKLEPRTDYLDSPRYREAHARGDILVAAVAGALLSIWVGRLSGLHDRGQPLNRARAAEEGAKAAAHLLTMSIRAIDYLPPLDVAFADFLAALIASDQEVVPDDHHGYRASIVRSFASYGIRAAAPQPVQVVGRKHAFRYAGIHADELHRRDEIYRLIWQNADLLEIPVEYYVAVEDAQASARVGPDGFVVREIVATYVQLLTGTLAELQALAVRHGGELVPSTPVKPSTKVQLQGGGTVIFDEFGRLKYHHPKPLLDWARQGARLGYLAAHGLTGAKGAIGSSLALPLGLRFAVMHGDAGDEAETW